MRTSRLLRGFSILSLAFCAPVGFGQNPPATPVPLITEVTPPSLSPANLPPGSNSLTLTILGANFAAGESVTLSGFGFNAIAVNPTVNATGTQMVANFTNVSLPALGTVTVTVTKRAITGGILLASNPYYLPVTPSNPSVLFETPVSSFVQGSLSGIAAADFNGDGIVDLAVVSQVSNTVSILKGNSGAFTTGASYPTGNAPSGVVAADFNGDGIPDLAVTNATDNTVIILLGNGDGTFRAGTTVSDPGVYPTKLVAADFNGDGKMDLAVVNMCGTGQYGCFPTAVPLGPANVAILLGNGDGTFNVSPTLPATGVEPMAIAAADLNEDGFIDLIVANASNTLTLLMGNGDGTFTAAQNVPLTGFVGPPTGIAIGDFNVDGTLDLAVTSSGDNVIGVFLNQNCAGLPAAQCSLTPAQMGTMATTNLSGIAAADMNGDGLLDLVVINSQAGSVSVLLGDGTGHFTLTGPPPAESFPIGDSPQALALVDFSQDGRLDVVTANSSGAYTLLQQKAVAPVRLASSNGLPSYGQVVNLTAYLTPPIGPAPTGTVTLYDGSTSVGSGVVSGNQASLQFTPLSAGTHQLTAVYNGDGNYLASTSSAVTEIVGQAQTTLTLSASPNPSSVGQSVALQGTLQSAYGLVSTGGTITFYNNGTQVGSVVIQANNINQESGGTQIAFVTVNTAILPVGSQTITANYSGDANLQASTGNMTQTVNPAPTNLTLTANPGAPTYPQNVTFTATLSPTYGNTPTGTVTFSMNGTTLGTANVSNNAAVFSTSTLSPGGHVIDAQYSGDANNASSANLVSITVAPPPTTTVLTSSVNPSFFNQPVVLVATPQSSVAGTPTGTMTFYDNLAMIGSSTLASGSAQISISGFQPGTHSLTATYSGDFNFAGSTSAALSQVVSLGPTVTTVTSLDNPMTTPYNVRFLVTATATYGGTPSGTVTLYDGSTVIGSGTLTSNPNGNTVQINVSGLTAGSHSITAKYSGSVSFGASTSTVLTQVMNLPGTTTSLSTSTNPVAYGQSVTLTASLVPGAQPTGSPLPSGTVTFFDGATSLGNGTVANNTAQISVSSLAAGSHTLTAKYNGDSNYTGSTSLPFTETVNQASTTASVSSSANPAAFGQPVTFTASVAPAYGGSATGTIAFLDGTNSLGSATLSNNSAQFTISTLAAGPHSITAKYSGDVNFTASTSSAVTETINLAATTTAVISSLNPASYGQSVTLSASIQPPSGVSATGTVTFFDGSTSLGTGTVSSNAAQLAVSSLLAGTHSMTAVYSGNSNLAGSTSSAVSEVVNPATTTTSIASSANPATVGQAVTFAASVQPAFGSTASGSVSFSDGTTLLGTVSLTNNSGQLSVFTLGAGSHSITAAYNGDAGTTASTSSVLSQTINQAATTTTVTASPNPSVFNQSVSFVITVSGAAGGTPTGTVSLMDGSTTLTTATLSGGTGRIYYGGLSPATHSITAVYSGDPNFTGSTSAAVNVVVNQASSTTSLSSILNPSTYGQAVTLTATVQAPQGINPFGTVTFMDGSATLGSSSLSNGSAQFTLSGLAAGSHTITAVYAGSTYLTGSTSPGLAQSVSAASSATTVSSSLNPAVFGQSVAFSATIQPAFGGVVTGTVTFLDGTVALGSSPVSGNAAQLSLSSLAVGSHAITAKYSGDSNVAGGTSAALTETVNPASSTISIAVSPNPATFGQAVVLTASVTPSVSGDQATGAVSFFDGTASLGAANLSNNSAQLSVSNLAVGSHSITASYAGDTNVSGSTSAALGETVNLASTTTTLVSNLNPATFGQSVTLMANVQAGSGFSVAGTVTFLDGSLGLGTVSLSNNSAQLTTSTLAPGAHTLTAVYNSNGSFATSTSPALTETVKQLTTTTTLASSANPALAGQSVTFTATVQAGAGNSVVGAVTFLDGSTTLGSTAVINNAAQLTISTLAIGPHSITATFQGSTDFASSTSSVLTETVNQSSTTTTLASSLNPAIFGQAVPLVATVQTASGGAATGTVTFYDGTNVLGIAGVQNNSSQHNVAQLTFPGFLGGTHTLTAAYSGDANYTASTSSALTETVNPASSSVTVGTSSNPSTFGQSVTLTATVVPSVSGDQATGSVTFFDGASSLGSANLSNNVAQISVGNFALGSHSITTTYAGDRNVSGSTSAALSEVVNPAATSTVLTSSANPIIVKNNVTWTATVSSSSSGAQTGTVNFYLDGSSTAAASVNLSNGTAKYSTNSLSAGSHSVVAVFNSTNPDFAGSTSSAFTQFVSDFTVAVSPSSLTVTRGTSGTYTLTVTPIGEFSGSVSLTCGGVPGGTTCAISPTQVTLSGSSSAEATVTITAAQNASKGTHTLTFTGTSGGLNHKVTVNLTVD